MSRIDFITKLPLFLQKSGAENVAAIGQTRVPLVSFTYCGVQFDLVYTSMITSMKLGKVQNDVEQYLLDDINQMPDKANAVSINGWLISSAMLEMITDRQVFSLALRIIKLWAKRRGVYGFNYGYLNGISLTIMLIKVLEMCRDFENESHYDAQFIVARFFDIFSNWDFSNPVFIHEVDTNTSGHKMYDMA